MTDDAGRVRERHPRIGQRAARLCSTASSISPRSSRAPSTAEIAEVSVDHLRNGLVSEFEPVAQGKGLGFSVDVARRLPRDDRHRPATSAPDPEEPALERVQVHRARQGAGRHRSRRTRLEPRRRVARDAAGRCSRSRSATPASASTRRTSNADLRGVRAGRRHHRAPLRRHRPRALDQPRVGGSARRRDHGVERARRGQHVHRLPALGTDDDRRRCPATRSPRPRPSRDDRGRRRPIARADRHDGSTSARSTGRRSS